MGQSRILPAFFGRIHPRNQTPSAAVLFVAILGAAGALLGRSAILPLVNAGGTCLAVVFLLICLGVLRLRAVQPNRPRPYRVRSLLIPLLGATGSGAMLVMSVYQPYAGAAGTLPLEWILFLSWVLLGAVLWLLARNVHTKIGEEERRRLILGDKGSEKDPRG